MPPAADEPFEIRRASPEDASRAMAIIAASLAEYNLPFEPEGRDADVASFGARSDHDDLVAIEAGGAVGVASVGPQGEEGFGWISKVFVARDARRRGVGRALLRAAHDAARARGYTRVGLRTRLVFLEAIALYESEGYLRSPASEGIASGDVVYSRTL